MKPKRERKSSTASLPLSRKPYSLVKLMKKHSARLASRAIGDPLLIGDTDIRETSESGTINVEAMITRDVVLAGMYADLFAMLAEMLAGDSYSEYTGFSVASANLTRKKGNLGKLVLKLVPTTAWSGTIVGSTPPSSTVWEFDMAQIEKPLSSHPALMDDTQNPDLVSNATKLELWRNEQRTDLRNAFKYLPTPASSDAEAVTLEGIVKKFAIKILRGVESYIVFAPVVSKTSVYSGRPETGAIGMIEDPYYCDPDFEYLKTGDHSVQNTDKTWTRTEKWTGADSWDHDLYDYA